MAFCMLLNFPGFCQLVALLCVGQTRELHKIGSKGEPEDMSRFVYNSMDLNGMEIKVQASRYRCVEEFYADAQIILHNCVLLYGGK